MSWEDVWNNARPRLSSIQDALRSLNSPRSRIIRVGQLDSELLDLELVNILVEPVRKALELINVCSASFSNCSLLIPSQKASLQRRFDPEIFLLIQLTLYRLSVWNLGASYGAKLQGLRYITPLSLDRKLARAFR